jgi:hypothetical protein
MTVCQPPLPGRPALLPCPLRWRVLKSWRSEVLQLQWVKRQEQAWLPAARLMNTLKVLLLLLATVWKRAAASLRCTRLRSARPVLKMRSRLLFH